MSSPDHIKRQKQIFLLLVTVIGLSIIAVFLQLDFLKQLEYSTWDSRVRVVADPAKADPKIKIIVIDQESLEALAKDGITWPWPRSLYAPVIKYLEHAGAKGLAIDLLFTETSAWGVEEDIQFGEALNPNFPVINTVVLHKAKHSLPEDKFQIWTERSGFSYQRSIDFLGDLKVGTHQSLTLPTNEILEHSFWLGNVSENSDQDGIFRHYQIGGYVEELPFLNLPFALFASSNQSDFRKLDSFIGDNNQLTVNFHGPALTYDTYRFEPVLKSANALELGEEPRVKPENFENAWVFLGAQAPGLLDLRPTPLAAVYPGVEYHATVLDNYLHSDFIKKVSLPITLLLCLVFLLLLNSSTLFFRSLRYELLAVLIALSAFIFLSGTLAAYNFWLPTAVPFTIFVLSAIATLSFQYYLEGRNHNFIRGAFKHYLSPKVIEQIIDNPNSALTLGGQKREVTIFFSDIAGFTTISEKLKAEQLVSLLNTYLSLLSSIILESGGTVDKYEGDAIIAFWNAPVDIENHALQAVKAALDCQRALKDQADLFREEFGVDPLTRIGIHTGEAHVGNFGSKERFDYTVIGDAANLASRLEGLNKKFGTKILISEQTYKSLHGTISARKIGDVRVKGKGMVVGVYEPYASGQYSQKHLENFEKARTVFSEGNFEKAKEIFEIIETDPVSKSYLARIEAEDFNIKNWSPVWSMTEK